ncbi:MAG: cytochrome c biogenesis protein CcsA [Bryobacterales bacterium]|nr:cytochrome c biogenesis protein CcsA [Bryobacterales bacterium]
MHESSIFWLRVAVVLYSVGLLHAILTVLRKQSHLFRIALATFRIGAVFHFVSLVELARLVGHVPVNNFYESASLCAFLFAVLFLYIQWRYEWFSSSLLLFPLVFLLALVGSTELPVASWSNPQVRDIWLLVHVLLILIGYTALVLTTVASIFYLIQERRLKKKRPGTLLDRLPALGTLDDLITRSMGVGFLFITLGLVTASIWAFVELGTRWITQPQITVAFATWGFFLIMIVLRTNAGWRGRKTALLTLAAMGCSALTWAAHVGLRSLLTR